MWLSHVQLLDSALPIGAFSHSFGLETLVQSGEIGSPGALREYVETMLFGAWAPCDALGVKAVYVYTPELRWDELWQLDQALHVQRAAREAREGMHKIGKRLLHLARSMHPTLPWTPLLNAVKSGRCAGTYPTVYGWITYHLGVPLQPAAEGYLYSCLVACINNAVRLMRIGQTQGQTLVAQMLPTVGAAWQQVADNDPLDFHTSVPAADIAMMRHETLYSRLFMS